jgi:hypothetical protein
MRQKTKLFIGNTEGELWQTFTQWLEDEENPVGVNHWNIDLDNLRIAVIYTEKT